MRAVSLREGGVELVAVCEAQSLRNRRNSFRIPGEVEGRCSHRETGCGRKLSGRVLRGELALQLPQACQRKPSRSRLAGLPAVYGDRGDPQSLGELDLSETHVFANTPHAIACIHRRRPDVVTSFCHGRQSKSSRE